MIIANLITAYGTSLGKVALQSITVSPCIKIDAEATIIGSIRSGSRTANVIVADDRAWLVRQGIDTSCIIELAGIVANRVVDNTVVDHACVVRSPPPPYADA